MGAPLDRAEARGKLAADVIGAAAGCGVSEARLIAVGRTTIALIREVAGSPAEGERARKLHEQVMTRTAAGMRGRQGECPAAIEAFERAERN